MANVVLGVLEEKVRTLLADNRAEEIRSFTFNV